MNNTIQKLNDKMNKRIGLNAFAKDNCRMAIITGFTIDVLDKGTPEERLTVNYLLSYGEGKNAVVRIVNENMVVISLDK